MLVRVLGTAESGDAQGRAGEYRTGWMVLHDFLNRQIQMSPGWGPKSI